MQQPIIAAAFAAGRLLPLLGITVFVTGGAGLIVYAARLRAKAFAGRVKLAQHIESGATRSAGTPDPQDYQFTEDTQGLSIAEQQQAARFFRAVSSGPAQALIYFMAARLIAFASLAGAAYLALAAKAWPLPLLGPTMAAGVGWFLPLIAVKIATKKHRKAVGAGLPDAIELLAVCADAGISLESGLQRVAHELRDSQPALAGELALTWAQISILPNRDQALINLADRIGLPSIRTVASTLSQSMRFGTPLAQSLRAAAAEMREGHLFQLEERANRLPALLTFPVMLLIMPTIFLIVGGPAVIKILEIFSRPGVGH